MLWDEGIRRLHTRLCRSALWRHGGILSRKAPTRAPRSECPTKAGTAADSRSLSELEENRARAKLRDRASRTCVAGPPWRKAHVRPQNCRRLRAAPSRVAERAEA